jgi:hypothetical protein
MINYADGYIGALVGSFDYFNNSVKMFNEAIEKSSKSRKEFDLTILTYPQILNRNSEDNRSPMTGRTIDEIGSDLSQLKSFGVDRVILAINAEKDYDVNKAIDFVKKLKKFCN